MRFNGGIPAGGATVIAYGEVDALIMIDKNRSISSDLTV
jgi:hypothetical protein